MKKIEKIYTIFLLSILLLFIIIMIAGYIYFSWFYKEPEKKSIFKEETKNINIPNCKIDKLVFNDKVRLIKCYNEQFYIMNKENNDITGPMNKEESMNAFKEYLDIDLLDWDEKN